MSAQSLLECFDMVGMLYSAVIMYDYVVHNADRHVKASAMRQL